MMSPSTSFFQTILNKKRCWIPSDYQYVPVSNGADELLNRALAVRVLELDVGSFIKEASKRDLPVDEYGKELMISNADDEDIHDLALNKLAASLPWDYDFEIVYQYKNALLDLGKTHHPVLMAGSIELGIFLVVLPILKFLGTAPMKIVATDIIGDEKVHVATNSFICKKLNLRPSKQIKELTADVVNWITEPLRTQPLNVSDNLQKFADADFWMKQSASLLEKGVCAETEITKGTAVLAFFETNKNNQPIYR